MSKINIYPMGLDLCRNNLYYASLSDKYNKKDELWEK